MTPPYLLLVDDDPDDCDLFSEAFHSRNPDIAVKYAGGGREVLDFLERCEKDQLPAVLLIDYQMPGINGRELLRILQANSRYRHLVKVMWSTSIRVKDMEDCKRDGALQYLIKPATNEDLDQVIHQMTTIFVQSARGFN